MASVPALNDQFFLFNDVVYRFVHVDHPANARLRDLVMQFAPTTANHPRNTGLSLHPLWSEHAGGIVLFEGLRRDGNTRTFLTASQVQQLRDAAARWSQTPASQPSQTSDLPHVNPAREPAASPPSAQQHSPVSAQSEQLTGPTVPADAARSRSVTADVRPPHRPSLSDADADPFAFEPRVVSYTIGGPGPRDLLHAPRQVVYTSSAELLHLRRFNKISVRTPDSNPQHAAPPVPPVVKKRPPQQHAEKFQESRELLEWARTCYASALGTWMAVDLEASELVPDVVTEIGIAVFPPPADAPAYYHLALPAPVVEGDSSTPGPPPAAPIAFVHGTTRHVSREEGILFLQTFVAKARSCGPLFVVFHDDRLETRLLFEKATILPGSQSDHHHSTVPSDCLTYFDTQSLFAGLTATHSTVDRRIGLTKLLSALRIPFDESEWHNAGNDAKWTLDCLFALLTKPASDVCCTCGKCL